mgnify:CR=1 FL=1
MAGQGKIYSGKSAVSGSAVSGMGPPGPKKFGSSANVSNNAQVSELEG